MRFPKPYTLKEIAQLIGAKPVGDEYFPIWGFNEIHVVSPGEIVFVDHPKYYDKALQSPASVILINKEVPCPKDKALLISNDPFRDFNTLTQHFRPFSPSNILVAPTAQIGLSTVIQAGAFIGNHVQIGERCIIHSGVVIYDHCIIGDDVTIHAGTILGADAFYYKKRPEGFDKLLSGGRVVIENKVDLGALCTIDRGVSGDTTIKEGTKIDNQVHVGHDTIIGKNCLIASQTGIAGCVVVEDNVTLWGQVGISSGLTIAQGSVVLAQSGVSKNTQKGKRYFGSPAEDAREKFKEMAAIRSFSQQKHHSE